MWGQGVSQEEFMIKDECILLDYDDQIVGHVNKKVSHTFTPENPRALVHRAFSVFLFNEEGKLLLQKRAGDKITFPNVWTNTCCSHPLYGFQPNEIDYPEHVADGSVPGVKNAAIRKLEHELGIATSHFKPEDFKFLTRLHYWAADVLTHGEKSPWGEHEIDYILFVKKNIPLSEIHPHPEEVGEAKYVSHEELKAMMADPNLLWSPWFRIIAERFLIHWWKDLNKTLTTDTFVDYKTIYRFDPTEEHMGGAGNARELFGRGQEYNPVANAEAKSATSKEVVGDKSLKQGAYGKVKIHKHSKLSQLLQFDEIFAVAKLLLSQKLNPVSTVKYDTSDPKYRNAEYMESLNFCNDILGKVSRSFAEVIRTLPKHLSIDIMIFYLALRALDTVEDDMTAFDKNASIKIKHLQTFHETALVTDGWCMHGVGEADEKRLLEEYYHVVRVFKGLPKASQEVIADITHRMGCGMASFVGRDLGHGTETLKDYNLYCHYVAGLVGEGLSRLFACTQYESPTVAQVSKTLANTMGLFLQKTNIIRDYLEDYVDGRSFWPQEIWMQYTTTKSLGEFTDIANRDKGIACLNHMVTDALECIPECLQYMTLLRTQEVFQFCAIPQVMAIATLRDVYNNPKVFTGVVKIRKGLAVKMMTQTASMDELYYWFYKFTQEIHDIALTLDTSDPAVAKTIAICDKVIGLTKGKALETSLTVYATRLMYVSLLIVVCVIYYISEKVMIALPESAADGKVQYAIAFDRLLDVNNYPTNVDKLSVLMFFTSLAMVFGYGYISGGRKPALKRAE